MKPIDKFTLSREDEALAEIDRTKVNRSEAKIAIAIFLLILIIVPAIQLFLSIPHFGSPEKIEKKGLSLITAYNNQLIEKKKEWERALEQQSFLQRLFPPIFQTFLTDLLHTGNEKAVIGSDGWLFYERDIRYFQTSINFNSVSCIIDFAKQLEDRGIEFLLMPVPLKPTYHLQQLSSRYSQADKLIHPDYERWKEMLLSAGIKFVPLPELMAYLREDTHWDVYTQEKAAELLANTVISSGLIELGETSYTLTAETITQRGDIYSMLQLDSLSNRSAQQSLVIHPIQNEQGAGYQPSRESPILFLGDSFSNIYSLQGMGWGNSAGLVEQLAYRLQLPVDAIRRNDEGSIATRRILENELKRGKDRLRGKRVLIWEFAERELAFGCWDYSDLSVGEYIPSSFLSLQSRDSLVVKGTIVERSVSPQPDKVTYADHVIALHLTDLQSLTNDLILQDAIVYTFGMKGRKLTPNAYLRAGETIQLTLKSWQDKEGEFGGLNRNELNDTELLLQEPVWGENIQRIDIK